MGGEILCQPTQASTSSSGLVLVARVRLRSFREKQFCFPSVAAPAAGGLQYLPLPYAPSIHVAISVSSFRSASLLGAGAVSESLSKVNFRASYGGILSLAKRRASSASCGTTAGSFSWA